jgi:hypothetical protein
MHQLEAGGYFQLRWTMSDAAGAFYLAAQTTGRLLDGRASLVINDLGAATVER